MFKKLFVIASLLAQPLLIKPVKPTEDPKVFVFDLDDVLVKTSRFSIFNELTLAEKLDFGWYYVWNGNPKVRLFEFLENEFGKQEPVNPNDPQEAQLYATGDGIRLPKIWCECKNGTYTGAQTIAMIKPKIDSYFADAREQRIMHNLINTIFDAPTLMQHLQIMDGAVELVQELAAQGHTLMILSNSAKEPFEEAFKKPEMQTLFKHFKRENCLVSGDIGLIKPQPKVYDLLEKELEKRNKKLQDCVFIDDNYNNILMARQKGIQSIWKEKNVGYDYIRHELKRMFPDLEII